MSEQLVVEAPRAPSLAVAGCTGRFPVRRVYCVGRNYAAHAVEMGHDPDREPPFFFGKPADAVAASGSVLGFPKMTEDLQHEVELVVAIGAPGAEIDAERALAHVYGYGVGLDMTKRDLQSEAKRLGRPWDVSKGFDDSAVCGLIQPATAIGHPGRGEVRLEVNGEVRQRGDLADQIWPVPDVISILSRYVELRPGDLIMTGTPSGVGKVLPGDTLVGTIAGVGEVRATYAK